MATFRAYVPMDSSWLYETYAIIDGNEQPITGGGTSVQFDWASSHGNVVLTLNGSGFSDPMSSAWSITSISATLNGRLAWTMSFANPQLPGDLLNGAINYGNPAGLVFKLNDTLFGTAGNDQLFGYAGDDKIYGRGGNDVIGGGSGHNTLSGGAGHDLFAFGIKPDGSVISTITDFDPNQDLISFNAAGFAKLPFGVLPATEFHIGKHAATPAQHIIYDANTGYLYYDANGSGAGQQELFAVLHPHLALSHFDFIVT
jgi:Ca2+-binding RTX toxin-like protein